MLLFGIALLIVVPTSSIQTIQNLAGGIFAEVLVQKGDGVEVGQILVRIDDTMSAASFRENQTQLDALEAAAARLRAEATGSNEIAFSPRILQERPDLAKSEITPFNKRHRQKPEVGKGRARYGDDFWSRLFQRG